MALIHRATLTPTKLELLTTWLPEQSWYPGPDEPTLTLLGAYRFDDPAGEVGVETLLVRAGDGAPLQVPLTYRAEPLAGAEDFLVGTTDHSVLGTRWVYDATGDPVYANVLAAAVLAGTPQAEEMVDADGELKRRDPSARVAGSGSGPSPEVPGVAVAPGDPTVMIADGVVLAVRRVLDGAPSGSGEVLTGTWNGQPEPVVLASARLR